VIRDAHTVGEALRGPSAGSVGGGGYLSKTEGCEMEDGELEAPLSCSAGILCFMGTTVDLARAGTGAGALPLRMSWTCFLMRLHVAWRGPLGPGFMGFFVNEHSKPALRQAAHGWTPLQRILRKEQTSQARSFAMTDFFNGASWLETSNSNAAM
jgi:hypothetical protein